MESGSDLANYGVEGLTMEYDESGELYYTELYAEHMVVASLHAEITCCYVI